jgi:hypothetical protein
MRGGGNGDEVGRGGVRGHFYSRKKNASIDHGGRRRRTAAMGPRSRHRSTQQSTNILRNRSTSLKLEKIIVITIFMAIFGTTRREIVAPDRRRS